MNRDRIQEWVAKNQENPTECLLGLLGSWVADDQVASHFDAVVSDFSDEQLLEHAAKHIMVALSALHMHSVNSSRLQAAEMLSSVTYFAMASALGLRSIPYSVYLQSRTWQLTREEALERASHRCQLCNSDKRLEVHHRTYERIGQEDDDDLIVLCRDCHAKFHDKLP